MINKSLWKAASGIAVLLALQECGKKTELPAVTDPAYRTQLKTKEDFTNDLRHWYITGKGDVEITGDSSLTIRLSPESSDLILWSSQDYAGSFQLEYRITLPDSPGTHIVFLCAQDIRGGDVTRMPPPPAGTFEQYLRDSVASYQISFHGYDESGRHVSDSKVRKNPGSLLLGSAGADPCRDNRDYIIDILKIDNRIQCLVDGLPVHDLRDRGGFSDPYGFGKIGFHIHGRPGAFGATIHHIRVFSLIPR